MTQNLAIAGLILLAFVAGFGVMQFLGLGDREPMETYAVRRGWTLKRVWCWTSWGHARRGDGRSYYRATFVTAEGEKKIVWFESTMEDNRPVERPSPFGR